MSEAVNTKGRVTREKHILLSIACHGIVIGNSPKKQVSLLFYVRFNGKVGSEWEDNGCDLVIKRI